MSAFGTSTPLLRAPPWGLVKTVGAAHPRSPRGRGVQATPTANPCTPTTERWVASNQ